MDEYKKEFIRLAHSKGALKVFGKASDYITLKSGRLSPWFFNIGNFNDGLSSENLSGYFANTIIKSGVRGKVLYGIPEKGVSLVSSVAIAMNQGGYNIGWCFSRKDEKTHGEASNLPNEDRIKKLIVGMIPDIHSPIIQLDDVFTDGGAKYDANKFLKSLGRNNLPLLAIAVDRQEIARNGEVAIRKYTEETGTRVVSILTASEIYQLLREENLASESALENMANYMRAYGTEEARA